MLGYPVPQRGCPAPPHPTFRGPKCLRGFTVDPWPVSTSVSESSLGKGQVGGRERVLQLLGTVFRTAHQQYSVAGLGFPLPTQCKAPWAGAHVSGKDSPAMLIGGSGNPCSFAASPQHRDRCPPPQKNPEPHLSLLFWEPPLHGHYRGMVHRAGVGGQHGHCKASPSPQMYANGRPHSKEEGRSPPLDPAITSKRVVRSSAGVGATTPPLFYHTPMYDMGCLTPKPSFWETKLSPNEFFKIDPCTWVPLFWEGRGVGMGGAQFGWPIAALLR